ncbi:MAG: hypothetical protein ACYSO1_03760, partial [Planctomycetota bacterium]
MSEILIVVLICIMLVVAGLVAVVLMALNATRRESSVQGNNLTQLQTQFQGLQAKQDAQSQSLEKNLRSGQENISHFLTNSQKTFGELKEQIGKLKSDSERLLQVS